MPPRVWNLMQTVSPVLDICDAPAFLTTPTLLAELKTELGDAPLSADRSFRFVASSGDVLRPRHISFSARSLTSSQERVLNLWVQTECGSAIVSTWPGAELNRSGALGLPFPGIRPLVVNYLGQPCRPNESGSSFLLLVAVHDTDHLGAG